MHNDLTSATIPNLSFQGTPVLCPTEKADDKSITLRISYDTTAVKIIGVAPVISNQFVSPVPSLSVAPHLNDKCNPQTKKCFTCIVIVIVGIVVVVELFKVLSHSNPSLTNPPVNGTLLTNHKYSPIIIP